MKKNEFVEVNLSFQRTLEYRNKDDRSQHVPTFRDLVTAETQPVYDAILEQSARGEKTPKYKIDVITKNDKVVSVWAHGEPIPYPRSGGRRRPHRFGVLLPLKSETKTEELNHKTIKDREAE
jgi:hypothetical protein